MSRPRYPIVLRSLPRRSRVLQIVLLILFSLLGQVLANAAGLPIPGGVIGMVLVLALLAAGLLRVRNVHR